MLAGGLVAASATLAGVYLVGLSPAFTRRTSRAMVALAGGIVLGSVFLHLLPEATRLSPEHAPAAAAFAFLVLYLIEGHTLPHVHGPHSGDAPGPHVHLGHMAVVGFAVHAVFDGLALGAGFGEGSGVAAPALIAVLAHKVPEGMALLSLLHHGGYRPRRALGFAWAVALMTPATAVLSYAVLGAELGARSMGVVLAFVAGSFLYISASDLLPEVRRNPRLVESALIVAGVAGMWLLRHV